ncbi:tape measure protein, partial [Roseateles sp.]|uniref:tape measure protein n=1 Tax=Roseateles sp. TaxID=1971397 RepID=UPI0037CAEF37
MAQTVDSAKFDFITDLSDINQLIARLKTVSITTKELAEATKYLTQLSRANAAEQRAAIADLNKLTAQSRLQTQQEREAAAATRASINEIQRKRQELKLQNEQMGKAANGMNQFRGSIDLLRGSMGGLAAVIGVNSFLDFTTNIFNAQSQIQAFKLSLDALLKDKTASAGLFAEVKEFVKESPFQFEETVTSVQKLISSFKAVGLSADEIQKKTIPVLRSLGNSASALGLGDEGLKRLIYAFTQVQSAGKLMGTELRQINETGIPMLSLLAEQTGIKIQDMAKAISDGKISFEIFEKAILSAGNAGGVFAGLMDIQAQTVAGRISNLKDTVFYAMGQIGDYFQGTGKSFLSFATSVVEGLAGTEAAFARTMTVVKNLAQFFASYKALQILLTAKNYLMAESQKAVNLVVEEGVLAKQASIAKAVEMTNAETAEAAAINQTRLAISAKTAEELKLIEVEMKAMNRMTLKQEGYRNEILLLEKQIAETWKLIEANLQLTASNKQDIISKNELIATNQKEIVTLQEKLAQQEKIIVSNRQGRADKALSIKTIKDEILAKRQLVITTEQQVKAMELENLELKKINLQKEKNIATNGKHINSNQAEIASIEKKILAKEKEIGVSRAASMQIAAEMAATDANTAAKIKATTVLGRLATATKAWAANLYATMGPMVAWTAGIYAVIKAFEMLSDAQEESRMSTLKGAIANNEEANSMIVKNKLANQEINNLSKLKEGSDEYRIAAKRIIDQYPDYFKGMDASTASMKDFNSSIRSSNSLLSTNIALLAQQARLDFNSDKIKTLQQSLSKAAQNDLFKNVDFSDLEKASGQLKRMLSQSGRDTGTGLYIAEQLKNLQDLKKYQTNVIEINKQSDKIEKERINKQRSNLEAERGIALKKSKNNEERLKINEEYDRKIEFLNNSQLEKEGKFATELEKAGDKKAQGIKASGQKQKQARQEIISDLEKSLRAEATALQEAEDNWRNGYDIKYNLYLADMENAKNNIKDKEKLKAKELEIETK